jgi:predicted MFS family arabinose efflux permease
MTRIDNTLATPAPAAPPDRLLTRPFVLLGLAELAYFTADGVAIYTLPMFVTGPVGSGSAGAGLAFGAFALSALLLRPLAGRLSDTRGRRPLLLGGALLAAVGLGLTAHTESLPAVVVLRLLLGVAEAGVFVAAFAAVADLAPPSRLGEALSYNSLGLYLGLAFGPPLGELLVRRGGYELAWNGAAVLALLCALIVLRIGETGQPVGGARGATPLIHRASIPVALGFCASLAVMGGFLAFASLHAETVGMPNASVPLFLYGMVVVVCRVVFAKVPDRIPSLPLGAGALLMMATGMSVTALWPTPAGLLVGAALVALGMAFSTPAFFSAVFARATASERGAASATASVFLDLGFGGGPILLGLVAQAAGVPWAFGAAAAVGLAGSVWTLHLYRRGS